MHPLLILLTLMGALVVQSTVLQVQPFSFIAPNLIVVFLLYVSMMRGSLTALYCGLLIGLIQDILFGTYLGLYAYTFATVGYFAGMTFRSYWTRQLVMVILIMLGYSFLAELTAYGLSRLFGYAHVDLMAAVTHTVRIMIWNGIFALLLYVPSVKLLATERNRSLAEESL
ncbi:rod shape-determining protein MreD [Tumebacillus avium]|uniref:Rod shape-determining protein MreD n=1 Tax=Tumebacillus avium TaxID=1903704 RepID=A0A1Y0ISM9_9BACL|nr:rod shape-determining protein MreD [Tumebacillus avium]ARU63280.1 rod shape-determining protein MreD [Tumebacillus avium]